MVITISDKTTTDDTTDVIKSVNFTHFKVLPANTHLPNFVSIIKTTKKIDDSN